MEEDEGGCTCLHAAGFVGILQKKKLRLACFLFFLVLMLLISSSGSRLGSSVAAAAAPSINAGSTSNSSTDVVPPPSSLKIGALVVSNTTALGVDVKQAIELAVQDVNDAEGVLRGTKLILETFDTGEEEDGPVQAAACGVELMKRGVVAVVGPFSSWAAKFAGGILGRTTHVPFVSYGATDSTLSHRFPYSYLLRVLPSDSLFMEAVASFIANYPWKEAVAFHMDDDSGSDAASSLAIFLQARGLSLVRRIPLLPWMNGSTLQQKLSQINAAQSSRVYVLHAHPEVGFRLLREAYDLKMMEAGYVWIVTEQMAIRLHQQTQPLDGEMVKASQGIISVRQYVPSSSPQLQRFLASWRNKTSFGDDERSPQQHNNNNNNNNKKYLPEELQTMVNQYALYAYDAVWAIAYGLDSYLLGNINGGKSLISFRKSAEMAVESGGESELAKMEVLEGGEDLRDEILKVRFEGASGVIGFEEATGDLIGAAFEYGNMVGRSPPRAVGFWWPSSSSSSSSSSAISTIPPTHHQLFNISSSSESSENNRDNNSFDIISSDALPNSTKMPIIWPGGLTDTPRGWGFAQSGRPLRIGVPRKAGYNELVSVSFDSQNASIVDGFCVQVFKSALQLLHYQVLYQFEILGDGVTTPQYGDLITKLADGEYDGVVGDVAILADRLQIVDFTQPYIESGLVVLVPIKSRRRHSAFAFLRPFTSTLWATVFASFMFTGLIIWILEHKTNDHFKGPPRKQFITVSTFIFSTLFFAHKEEVETILGRIVLVLWLFVILIMNSSYTANLTSILTVEQLLPTIQGLDSLIQTNLPIGYQTGSFVRQYLINLGVNPGRLKDLQSRVMYEDALNLGAAKGGVAAIVDELPYVQLLEAANCNKYTIAGAEFTKSGWGFAFPRGSQITADLSEAILQMSQSGELQRIRDYWFKNDNCQQETTDVESGQLDIYSFWGLFLVTGVTSLLSIIIRLFLHLLRNDGNR